MKHTVLILAAAVFFAAATPASAQEDRTLNSVVVTASRVDRSDASKPAITIKRQADFVLFGLTYVNGTVDPKVRKDQQRRTFDDFVKAAEGNDQISLFYGDEYSRAPIETVTFEEAYSYNGHLDFIVKMTTQSDDTYDRVRSRVEQFVEKVGTKGRTDYIIDDEQFIGLDNPDRYRGELLTAISADVTQLKQVFAASEIKIDGLHQPLTAIPVGVLEVEIFIPYEVILTQ